jgi:hypothetical protein
MIPGSRRMGTSAARISIPSLRRRGWMKRVPLPPSEKVLKNKIKL